DDLRLVNPISSDLGVMRPSILANLIAAAGRNADRGVPDARLFELGPQYASAEPDGQTMAASGLRSGRTGHRNWAQAPRPVDAFDAKADVLAALGALGLPTGKVQVTAQAPAWYHPGRSGAVQLGPKTLLAHFGEVHPGVLAKMGVKGPMAAFEIYLDNAPKPKVRKSAARPHLTLSALQPVERDFAFVLDRDVPAAVLIKAAFGADKALISEVRVFDLFEGGALGEGKKSLAVTVTLQPKDKTLTEGEIEEVSRKIVENAHKATGGHLRS
ncbi:MAG TPA: phenylalanine--tRNA ligase subunit beta, partial [Rhodospirillales bacterium]|nr:phenylalanine--tRNA ligase subunit beta [Rhodospirillales bacterium]